MAPQVKIGRWQNRYYVVLKQATCRGIDDILLVPVGIGFCLN